MVMKVGARGVDKGREGEMERVVMGVVSIDSGDGKMTKGGGEE